MKPGVRSVFIGMLRNKKGGFSWTDDTPVNFVNWDEQEPENFDDQCVEMMADTMKWRVSPCIVKKHFICQNNKAQLVIEDRTSGRLIDEKSNGLPGSALVAIIVSIAVVLLLIVIAAFYFRNKSIAKPKFRSALRQQSISFENALYNVDSSSMEFQDEQKSSL